MRRAAQRGVVLVGGGLAAQRAAEALRRSGYDGSVRMVCEEPHRPYDRPPLSKDLLTGRREASALALRPDAWYRDHDVELLCGERAVALEPVWRRLRLESGTSVRYEHLVIATGSRPRRLEALPLGDRILELRTLEDALALRAALLAGAERLVIVGAGLIGMEVASSVRALGVEAVLVEAAPAPLARVLPAPLARWLTELHIRAGVRVLLGRAVASSERRRRGVGLTLDDGRRLVADLVLVAAGSLPATEWLAGSGLASAGALAVDSAGRAAAPGVHAAGDAACFPDPFSGRHLPTPHWEAAVHQGAAVAFAITGAGAPPPPSIPMFWTDQHGVRVQCLGRALEPERIEIEGDLRARDFIAWMHRGGRAVGALIAGRPRALPEVRRVLAGAQLPATA